MGARRGVKRMTTNGGRSAYDAQSLALDGTACRIISARVLTPVWRLKPYALSAFSMTGTRAFSACVRNTSMASLKTRVCPPNAAANVEFQQRASRTTPIVPSAFLSTRAALVPSRAKRAVPEPSSPPTASVSPADAKSVRTIPASYDLYTYGVIPKYFAGGGVHPTKSTTSCSRSRHSHENAAPPPPSGSTRPTDRSVRVLVRLISSSLKSSMDGLAKPSAGRSSDAAASRALRTYARVPTSVEKTSEDLRPELAEDEVS